MKSIAAVMATALAILSSVYPVAAEEGTGMPLVGLLGQGTRAAHADRFAVFRDKMRELGHVENRNIRFAYRYAEGKNDRLPALAAELVRLNPDLIVTTSTPSTRAARKATRVIPIVMHGGDPVRSGLVASLARPGGNITGHTVFPGPEFYAKRLEILKEAVPATTRIGILYVGANSFHQISLRAVKASASKLGAAILPVAVDRPDDVEGALATMKRKRADAFLHFGSPLLSTRIKRTIAFALDNRLPFMCTRAVRVRQGCLMSYGVNFHDLYRRMAITVDKILKGANPAEMPVQQPTKFDLVLNLKTAKALGITFPPSILLRATEVIE